MKVYDVPQGLEMLGINISKKIADAIKKSGKSETRNYSTFGNFWTKQISVENNFRDILDGGTSEPGTAQFYGPIIGGEFPTQTRLLNQL